MDFGRFSMICRFGLLILGLFLLFQIPGGLCRIVDAQSPPAATAAPTSAPPTAVPPDPTVVFLQQQVDTLATRVTILDDKVDVHKGKIEWEALKYLFPFLATAAIISAVAVYFGFSAPRKFRDKCQAMIDTAVEQTREKLNQAIYRVDPTNQVIHVPADRFDTEGNKLRSLGFIGLRPYGALGKAQLEGIVIYRADTIEDIDLLLSFIEKEQAQPEKVGFVVYAPEEIPDGTRISRRFGNATLTNSVVPMVGHIYNMARVLEWTSL